MTRHRLPRVGLAPLLTAALLLAAAGTAGAAEKPKGLDWHVAVEATTHFPLDLGARIALEAPYGIRVATLFGVVPGFYVDAVNEIILAAGGYSAETGTIVSDALDSSFLWRIQAGWRPFRDHGFYFEAGYALALLAASIEGQTLLDAARTVDLPPGVELPLYARRTYESDSTLHLITAEIGWQWVVADLWVFRAAAGVAATVASQTTMGYRSNARGDLRADSVSDAYALWLDDVFTSVLITPVIAVSVGLRVF